MAKKDGGERKNKEKEGKNLLGRPNFVELENGRFKCVETGHELPALAKCSYAQTKHCRLGLIDSALAHSKPPLNMFRQDLRNRSKLICKLTGDTVNKSEEHIWKHINGKRFLNMLEKKEAEKEAVTNGMTGDQSEQRPGKKSKPKAVEDDLKKKKKKKKKPKVKVSKIIFEVRGTSDKDLEEAGFWMPPVGDRWHHDSGGDRWGSGSDSVPETDKADEGDGTTDADNDAGELSQRTKRMSIETGHNSLASRKKKKKTKPI